MLKEKADELLKELNDQLFSLDIYGVDSINNIKKAIEISLISLSKLKDFLTENDFQNQEDEIFFFKDIKPYFTSKVIYYNSVFNIEAKKPYGIRRDIKRYYNSELNKLKIFYEDNQEFYKYYRAEDTCLDFKYFVRGKADITPSSESYYFEVDVNFSTSHDLIIARILSNDIFQLYIERKLSSLDKKKVKNTLNIDPKTVQSWTGSKAALIELLYALHSESVFNNGSSDIKNIALYFEKIFNIDLGDYYRTFLELRMRKNSRTKFLNSVTESLNKRMDEAEEKR